MNTQIKNYLSKLLLTVAAAVGILTGTIGAQQLPDKYEAGRERLGKQMRQIESLRAKRNGARKAAAILTGGEMFQNGKDFTTAAYDAEWMDAEQEAFNYTIIDLAYLIDRLEGQPEAAKLQKTLRAVLRGTSTGELVKKDIEKISNAYLARQKVDRKWYFNAGKTSINLLIASYMGEDASIKKGLNQLQSLIKTAPKATAKEILNPMSALAKYAAQKTYTDEDYTAIYEGVGNIIDAAKA